MINDIHSAGTAMAAVDGHLRSMPYKHLVAPVRLPRLTEKHSMPTREVADEDGLILARVRHALHHSGYGQLRRVETRCEKGCVVLEGSISTYYLKQVAQEVVTNLSDVQTVENDLHVQRGQ